MIWNGKKEIFRKACKSKRSTRSRNSRSRKTRWWNC